jgi:pyruvate-formate lyase-activating enzyme
VVSYFLLPGRALPAPPVSGFGAVCRDKGIYTATSTNAHYLNDQNARRTVESGLDRLIISLDGTTQDVYQQYRVGGKLEKVLEGTRNVVRWRRELKSSTPRIIFQFLVVRPMSTRLTTQSPGRSYGRRRRVV